MFVKIGVFLTEEGICCNLVAKETILEEKILGHGIYSDKGNGSRVIQQAVVQNADHYVLFYRIHNGVMKTHQVRTMASGTTIVTAKEA